MKSIFKKREEVEKKQVKLLVCLLILRIITDFPENKNKVLEDLEIIKELDNLTRIKEEKDFDGLMNLYRKPREYFLSHLVRKEYYIKHTEFLLAEIKKTIEKLLKEKTLSFYSSCCSSDFLEIEMSLLALGEKQTRRKVEYIEELNGIVTTLEKEVTESLKECEPKILKDISNTKKIIKISKGCLYEFMDKCGIEDKELKECLDLELPSLLFYSWPWCCWNRNEKENQEESQKKKERWKNWEHRLINDSNLFFSSLPEGKKEGFLDMASIVSLNNFEGCFSTFPALYIEAFFKNDLDRGHYLLDNSLKEIIGLEEAQEILNGFINEIKEIRFSLLEDFLSHEEKKVENLVNEFLAKKEREQKTQFFASKHPQ